LTIWPYIDISFTPIIAAPMIFTCWGQLDIPFVCEVQFWITMIGTFYPYITKSVHISTMFGWKKAI
jgi:hypothetical protein